MTYWIVPWNSRHYDLKAALATFGFVDWRQFFNYEVGDTVFIYCAKPVGRLVYEMVVERVNIPLAEICDDSVFYIKKTGWTREPEKGYVRFRLISPLNPENEALTHAELTRHGMTYCLQRPVRAKDELLTHILGNIKSDLFI